MDPPKSESDGTHVYAPPFHLSPTCMHIFWEYPYHLIDGDHDTADEVIEWESGEAPW